MTDSPPATPTPRPRPGQALRRPAVAAALGVVLAAGALAAGCRDAEERPPNVVVLLADTLRADHLGAYGYGRPTSPGLDALAAEGVLFESARAQAPCTFPSVNSLLTSRDPASFLGRPPGHLGIPAGLPSLAHVLAAHGYATAAVSASPIVRATPSEVNTEGGFGTGFQIFDETCLWREAECVGLRAEAIAATLREPFFLYLHYMDPHDPYAPPEGAPRRFAGEYGGEHAWAAEGDPNPLAERVYDPNAGGVEVGEGDGGPAPLEVDPADLDHLVGLYDDEIAYWDGEAARLLSRLAERELLERTVVAVVSDHGESFLEAGHLKHCRTVDDREIRTPFVLRLPGAADAAGEDRGLRVAAPVSNLDLVPTLLDAAGIEPPPGLEGRSLLPWIEAAAAGRELPGAEERVVFSAWGPLRAATGARFKLVRDLRSGESALYDLAADPAETRDVLAENRRAYHRLRAAMDDRLARSDGGGVEESEELERQLRALGYLQ